MIQVITENRKCPEHIQRRIARAGGHHISGQPWFRVVWGWSRLTWVGGKWEEYDQGTLKHVTYEYREVPKYDPFFRWHIEKLMPAEFFGSPDYWYESTLEVIDGQNFYELGPYPNRGEYEHCFTLQDPTTQAFLDLSPSVVDRVVQAVERSRYLVHKDKRASLELLRRRQAQVEAEWESYADMVLDDCNSAFGGVPWSRVPAAPGEIDAPTLKQTLSIDSERKPELYANG